MQQHEKSPQTIKHALALVRCIIRFCAVRGLCAMPAPSRLQFNFPQVDNVKTEVLTPEQLKALFQALETEDDPFLVPLVRHAIATGMRRGRTSGLTLDRLRL